MTLRRYAEAGAVLLGSLALVGPLVYLVVAVALEAALAATVMPEAVAGPAVVFVALALAVYAASEVAELQLHGYAALRRGTRGDVALRHAVLSLLAVVGVLEAGWFALAAFSWSAAAGFDGTGTPPLVGALAALLALAAAGTLLVFGVGVLEGYRRAGRRPL